MSTSSTDAASPPARRAEFLSERLNAPVSGPARAVAGEIAARHPGSAVLLYGSGNSVLKDADLKDVLFDFYVIAPSYASAYRSPLLRMANYLAPPNVFYCEAETPSGRARAKYAVLSIAHFEKLVSKRTFHSYFWARFAQPCRIALAPPALRPRLEKAVAAAIDTFVARSQGLVAPGAGAAELWRAGLAQSYKAELRAEQPDRVDRLLASYGDWPARVTLRSGAAARLARTAWRVRAIQGGVLSVIRLLKASLTFHGGVDYIAWKISRHAGFDLPVREWERRWPLISAPILAHRYYRLRSRARA
jgi:hypothetical protein